MKQMTTRKAATHLRRVSDSEGQAAPPRPADLPKVNTSARFGPIRQALKGHWPEYLMEAFGLGLFMVSACAFAILLDHPASPVHQAIPDAMLRRVLTGAAMGLTAIANTYSPWGKRSGAHLNPSFTWAFFRLGKVEGWDAVFYSASQFIGGTVGVLIARAAFMNLVAHPAVNYAATVPGPGGVAIAFVAEVVISFILLRSSSLLS